MDLIRQQFDYFSENYDNKSSKLIPCFDDFYGIAIENLNLSAVHPRILDLGAGTGLFAQKVLDRCPESSMELVDISDKMLAIAKARFGNNDKVTITKTNFLHLIPIGKFGAIISSLAIHHLEHDEKRQLYQKIFAWPKPGGTFINAEQVLGGNEYFEDLYSARWKEKVEVTDLGQDELELAYERIKLDKRAPLFVQLNWFREIGFDYVDCLYKNYAFAVIYAQKKQRATS